MLSAPQGANSEDMNKNLAKSASGLPIVLPLRLYFCLFHRVTREGANTKDNMVWIRPSYTKVATFNILLIL